MIILLPFAITYNLFVWGKGLSTISALPVLP
jgi:hypothetical protein